MIRLILVRHGNTFEAGEIPIQVGAKTDLPLTALGKKQAEAMGRYLSAEGIVPKAIYSGDLKRQKDSAQIIGNCLGVQSLLEPALTEIDYGPWEGLSGEEIGMRWPQEHLQWIEGKWPQNIFVGSEAEYRGRIEGWLGELRKKGEETVAAVTSNGVLRLFQNEKVKTGHFCEIHLFEDSLKIIKWNRLPNTARDSKVGLCQGGCSDFLAGARGIAKGKTRSEGEKSEAKPTQTESTFE